MKRLISFALSVCIAISCMSFGAFASELDTYPLFGKTVNSAEIESRNDDISMLRMALMEYVTHLKLKSSNTTKGMSTPFTKGCKPFENDLFYTLSSVYGGYWTVNYEKKTYSDGTSVITYTYTNNGGVVLKYSSATPKDIFIEYSGLSLFPYAYITGQDTAVISKNYVDLYNRCKSVVDSCRRGAEDNDLLFEKRVHDWICKVLNYDNDLKIFSAEEALKSGKGVCQAYAELFQLLLRMGGMDCSYVWGTAKGSDGKVQKHAWNSVKINGSYYYVDVTWDDVNEKHITAFKKKYADYAPFEIVTEKDSRGYKVHLLKGTKGKSWIEINADYIYDYFNRNYKVMSGDHYIWTDEFKIFL